MDRQCYVLCYHGFVSLNKLLNKQVSCMLYHTQWRTCDVIKILIDYRGTEAHRCALKMELFKSVEQIFKKNR